MSEWEQTSKIALISGLGNWIGDLILYPIDTISTRLKAAKDVNNNSILYIKNAIKNDGISLYRGFLLSFPASFIPTSIYVFSYEYLKRQAPKLVNKFSKNPNIQLIIPFFVSCFAQLLCLIPYLPVDTVRTRMQMPNYEYKYSSLTNGLIDITKKEGFMRCYKSSKVYVTAKTLYTGVQFQMFELIRLYAGPSIQVLIFNTMISTFIATTLVNPLEVLLTNYSLVDTLKKKLIFSNVVKAIYHLNGLVGFYKGYGSQIITHSLYALCWLPFYQIAREKYGITLPD